MNAATQPIMLEEFLKLTETQPATELIDLELTVEQVFSGLTL
ncbi:MAG: hypothetical protein U7127_12345 [Phormidium sp.]